MASSKTIKDDELVEGPAVESIEVEDVGDDEPAGRVTYFTLTEVDAWVYANARAFERRVQVTPITLPRERQRVIRNDGVLFDSWPDAIQLANAANRRAEAEGDLAGRWSSKTIGERRIYIPLREAVA